jgi:hypothetical protein
MEVALLLHRGHVQQVQGETFSINTWTVYCLLFALQNVCGMGTHGRQ